MINVNGIRTAIPTEYFLSPEDRKGPVLIARGPKANRALRRHPAKPPRKASYRADPHKRLVAKAARVARRVQR